MVFWFIGLSGAGKTTLGRMLEQELSAAGNPCYVIDGDEIRNLFDRDLGYTPAERQENIKRIIYGAYVLERCGVEVIVCNISPFESLRRLARKKLGNYREIFLNKKLENSICEDKSGVYQKNMGKTELVGIDFPFDPPEAPDLVLDVDAMSVEETFQKVREFAAACYAEDAEGSGL